MVASLGIVLPAYNEEARLGPALDELFAYLCAAPAGALPETVGVLVVDDGSTDGTAALVRARSEFAEDGRPGRRQCPTLALLSVPHGGKGSAVRAGMLAAEGELLVFADADMATPRISCRGCWPRSKPPTSRWAAASSPTGRTCGLPSRASAGS